jgi:ferric-dicitrate binding protein FerR (iron transport regulator)
MDENDRIAALIQMAGKRPAVPADVAARVRAAVHEEWERSAGRRRTRTRLAAAAAAVIVLAAAGFVASRKRTAPRAPLARMVVAGVESVSGAAIVSGGRFVEAGTPLRAADALETAHGATASLRWGGATLRVDGDTHVRLDSDRALFLDRGALFVASSGRRVVVTTPLGEIRDVGTEFEVRVGANAVRVRVREGRVDLRRGAATHSASAGVELSANAAGAVTQRAIARSGGEWDWIVRAAPAMALEGRTLRGVVDAVSREKGLTPVYENVRDAELHGSVALAPDDALQAALTASSASARVDGDKLIVRGKR